MLMYERTEDGFKKAFDNLEMMLRWHKKPFWLVALQDRYVVSAVKPRMNEIAKGTTANLYDVDLNIIESVDNF